MSKLVSALNEVVAARGVVRIEEVGLQGMLTVRGDLSARAMKSAVKTVGDLTIPAQGHITSNDGHSLCWMSPDEVLLLCPYAEARAHVDALTTALAKAHALVVDVSDARAMFRVSGPFAREVMAKLAPVDLRPSNFTPGMFRRTRIAQIPAAFWMPEEDAFNIICFRSNARYMFDLLEIAAQPGSEVNHLT